MLNKMQYQETAEEPGVLVRKTFIPRVLQSQTCWVCLQAIGLLTCLLQWKRHPCRALARYNIFFPAVTANAIQIGICCCNFSLRS